MVECVLCVCPAYPDTYYEISIQAHNDIGLSDMDTIIVKTARGTYVQWYTSHTKQTVRVRVVYLQPAVYGVRKTPLPAQYTSFTPGSCLPKTCGGKKGIFYFCPSPSLHIFDLVHMHLAWLFHADEQMFTQISILPWLSMKKLAGSSQQFTRQWLVYQFPDFFSKFLRNFLLKISLFCHLILCPFRLFLWY